MQLQIKTRGFDITRGLEVFIEEKVRLSLTRFSQKIHSVYVTLSDMNGPKGGEDKKCLITVHLGRAQPVVLHHIDADMYDAISHCCHRVKRSVSRQLDKSNHYKALKPQYNDQAL